jgi:S1-C subfamily serine protease
MPPVTTPPAVDAPQEAEPTAVRRRWHRSPRTWSLVALGCVVLLALALWRTTDHGPAPLTRADVDRSVQRGLDKAQEQERNTPPDATVAYNTVRPSLVTVTTSRPATAKTSAESALGAGVVINAQGAVLTALHVVEGGGPIQVQFADGTEAAARVASSEPASDIAVLVVDHLPSVVVPAVMGGTPQIGAAVFAVGNPLGLQASLSAGVVSANNRRVRSENGRTLADLIQFDAAVNPGNSGGPLLNRGGQVVGIVTGLANPSKQAYFVGIGFAVPIATAGGVAGGPQQ